MIFIWLVKLVWRFGFFLCHIVTNIIWILIGPMFRKKTTQKTVKPLGGQDATSRIQKCTPSIPYNPSTQQVRNQDATSRIPYHSSTQLQASQQLYSNEFRAIQGAASGLHGHFAREYQVEPPTRSSVMDVCYREVHLDRALSECHPGDMVVPDQITRSLLKFPLRTISVDMIQGLLTYTQIKYAAQKSSPCHSRSSLSGPSFPIKRSIKNIHICTRTRTDSLEMVYGKTERRKRKICSDFEERSNRSPARFHRDISYNHLNFDVRYLHDVTRFVRDSLRSVCNDDVCPSMLERYSQHRREHHQTDAGTLTQTQRMAQNRGHRHSTGSERALKFMDNQSSIHESRRSHTSMKPVSRMNKIRQKLCKICNKKPCTCKLPPPCACPENRPITFKEILSTTRFYTQETSLKPCTCDLQNSLNTIIDNVNSWLRLIPMSAGFTNKELALRNNTINNLTNYINKYLYNENKCKEVIMASLEELPMWLPPKGQLTYKTELAEKLLKRIQDIDFFGGIILDWVETIPLLKFGPPVDKTIIAENLLKKLKAVTRNCEENQLERELKNSTLEELNKLPVGATDQGKYELAKKLATALASLRPEIIDAVKFQDDFAKAVSDWIQNVPYKKYVIVNNALVADKLIQKLKDITAQASPEQLKYALKITTFNTLEKLPVNGKPDTKELLAEQLADALVGLPSNVLNKIRDYDLSTQIMQKWIRDLTFQPHATVQKDEIAERWMKKLKNIFLSKSPDAYKNDLKLFIMKELKHLPVDRTPNEKEVLAENLADTLAKIPPKPEIMVEKVRYWVNTIPFDCSAEVNKDILINDLVQDLKDILATAEPQKVRDAVKKAIQNQLDKLPVVCNQFEKVRLVGKLTEVIMPDLFDQTVRMWAATITFNPTANVDTGKFAHDVMVKIKMETAKTDPRNVRDVIKNVAIQKLNKMPFIGSELDKERLADKLTKDLGVLDKETGKRRMLIETWVKEIFFNTDQDLTEEQINLSDKINKKLADKLEKAKPGEVWLAIQETTLSELEKLSDKLNDVEILQHSYELADTLVDNMFKETLEHWAKAIPHTPNLPLEDFAQKLTNKLIDITAFEDADRMEDSMRETIAEALNTAYTELPNNHKYIEPLMDSLKSTPKARDKFKITVSHWLEKIPLSDAINKEKVVSQIAKQLKIKFKSTSLRDAWQVLKRIVVEEIEKLPLNCSVSEMYHLAEDLASRFAPDVYDNAVYDWVKTLPFKKNFEVVPDIFAKNLSMKLKNIVTESGFDIKLSKEIIMDELEKTAVSYDSAKKELQAKRLIATLDKLSVPRDVVLEKIESWVDKIPLKPSLPIKKIKVIKDLTKKLKEKLGSVEPDEAWSTFKEITLEELKKLPVNGDSRKIDSLASDLVDSILAAIINEAVHAWIKTLPFEPGNDDDKTELEDYLTDHIREIINFADPINLMHDLKEAIYQRSSKLPLQADMSKEEQFASMLAEKICNLPRERDIFIQVVQDWIQYVPFKPGAPVNKRRLIGEITKKLKQVVRRPDTTTARDNMKNIILEVLEKHPLECNTSEREALIVSLVDKLIECMLTYTISFWVKSIPLKATPVIDLAKLTERYNDELTNIIKTVEPENTLNAIKKTMNTELKQLPINCDKEKRQTYLDKLVQDLINRLTKLPPLTADLEKEHLKRFDINITDILEGIMDTGETKTQKALEKIKKIRKQEEHENDFFVTLTFKSTPSRKKLKHQSGVDALQQEMCVFLDEMPNKLQHFKGDFTLEQSIGNEIKSSITNDVEDWIEDNPQLNSDTIAEESLNKKFTRDLSKKLADLLQKAGEEKEHQNEKKTTLGEVFDEITTTNTFVKNSQDKVIGTKDRVLLDTFDEKSDRNLVKDLSEDIQNWIQNIPQIKGETQEEERQNRTIVQEFSKQLADLQENCEDDKQIQIKLRKAIKLKLEEVFHDREKNFNTKTKNKLVNKLLDKIEKYFKHHDSLFNFPKENSFQDVINTWFENISELQPTNSNERRINRKSLRDLNKTLANLQSQMYEGHELVKKMYCEIKNSLDTGFNNKGIRLSTIHKEELINKLLNEILSQINKNTYISAFLEPAVPLVKEKEPAIQEALKNIQNCFKNFTGLTSESPFEKQAHEKMAHYLIKKFDQLHSLGLNENQITQEIKSEIDNKIDSILTTNCAPLDIETKNKLSNELLNITSNLSPFMIKQHLGMKLKSFKGELSWRASSKNVSAKRRLSDHFDELVEKVTSFDHVATGSHKLDKIVESNEESEGKYHTDTENSEKNTDSSTVFQKDSLCWLEDITERTISDLAEKQYNNKCCKVLASKLVEACQRKDDKEIRRNEVETEITEFLKETLGKKCSHMNWKDKDRFAKKLANQIFIFADTAMKIKQSGLPSPTLYIKRKSTEYFETAPLLKAKKDNLINFAHPTPNNNSGLRILDNSRFQELRSPLITTPDVYYVENSSSVKQKNTEIEPHTDELDFKNKAERVLQDFFDDYVDNPRLDDVNDLIHEIVPLVINITKSSDPDNLKNLVTAVLDTKLRKLPLKTDESVTDLVEPLVNILLHEGPVTSTPKKEQPKKSYASSLSLSTIGRSSHDNRPPSVAEEKRSSKQIFGKLQDAKLVTGEIPTFSEAVQDKIKDWAVGTNLIPIVNEEEMRQHMQNLSDDIEKYNNTQGGEGKTRQAIGERLKNIYGDLDEEELKRHGDALYNALKENGLTDNTWKPPSLREYTAIKNANRSGFSADLVEKVIDVWFKTLPIIMSTPKEEARIDEAKKNLIMQLKQARCAIPVTSPQHDAAVKDEAKKFLREVLTDPYMKSDELYLTEITTKLAKSFKGVPIQPIDELCIKPYKSPADILFEYIQDWVSFLPVEGDNANIIKQNIIGKLISKISSFNMNPDVFNDHSLYQDLIQDEIDTLLNEIPKNQELDKYLPAFYEDLISKIMIAREKIIEELAGKVYRQQLREKVNYSLSLPSVLTVDEKALLELLKDKLADAFINLNYTFCHDPNQRCKYKMKISTVIDNFIEEILHNHPCVRLDPSKMKIDLHNALVEVPVPKDDAMKCEVEQVRIRDIIADWMMQIPLRQETALEILRRYKLAAILAKRIHDIEMEKEKNAYLNVITIMSDEITKFLKKLPLLGSQDQDIAELVQILLQRLLNSEQCRKFISYRRFSSIEGQSGVSNLCSSFEDQEDLTRIKAQRNCKVASVCPQRPTSCKDAAVASHPMDCSSQTGCGRQHGTSVVSNKCFSRTPQQRDASCVSFKPSSCPISPRVVVKEYIWDTTNSCDLNIEPVSFSSQGVQNEQTSRYMSCTKSHDDHPCSYTQPSFQQTPCMPYDDHTCGYNKPSFQQTPSMPHDDHQSGYTQPAFQQTPYMPHDDHPCDYTQPSFQQTPYMPHDDHPCDYTQPSFQQTPYMPHDDHPCDYTQPSFQQTPYMPHDDHPCDYTQPSFQQTPYNSSYRPCSPRPSCSNYQTMNNFSPCMKPSRYSDQHQSEIPHRLSKQRAPCQSEQKTPCRSEQAELSHKRPSSQPKKSLCECTTPSLCPKRATPRRNPKPCLSSYVEEDDDDDSSGEECPEYYRRTTNIDQDERKNTNSKSCCEKWPQNQKDDDESFVPCWRPRGRINEGSGPLNEGQKDTCDCKERILIPCKGKGRYTDMCKNCGRDCPHPQNLLFN